MRENHNRALIAAAPGPLMDGLKAVLTTFPQLKNIDSISDVPTLLNLVTERHPNLILLDFDCVASGTAALLEQSTVRSPDTKYVILVDDVDEHRTVETVENAIIIFKGSSPLGLFAAVAVLLPPQGAENSGKQAHYSKGESQP